MKKFYGALLKTFKEFEIHVEGDGQYRIDHTKKAVRLGLLPQCYILHLSLWYIELLFNATIKFFGLCCLCGSIHRVVLSH